MQSFAIGFCVGAITGIFILVKSLPEWKRDLNKEIRKLEKQVKERGKEYERKS